MKRESAMNRAMCEGLNNPEIVWDHIATCVIQQLTIATVNRNLEDLSMWSDSIARWVKVLRPSMPAKST